MLTDQPELFLNNSAEKEDNVELKEMIEQEYNTLIAQRKELENQITEIDKKLEPILAYMKASGKKATTRSRKRGRKPRSEQNVSEAVLKG
ncbi:MAG TPA: hypothetical protein VHO70_07570 [Chitinispirillaceae bacterium]|nr:hypothetical protein [Chitinispirillaceae bacterium]